MMLGMTQRMRGERGSGTHRGVGGVHGYMRPRARVRCVSDHIWRVE
jgi:hypothetical protein